MVQRYISHSISNTLHYSSEIHPYVGEFSYFCSGLTEHKNERKRKRQDFYSMAVVNDAYAIFHGEDFSPP